MSGLELIGLGLSVVGGLQEASATRRAGREQEALLEAEAKQATAISQREAEERRREGRLLASRQRALAAAQGGAADPSVLNLLGETAAETERAATTEIYRGDVEAAGARARGRAAVRQARSTSRGILLSTATRGLGGFATAFDRFGERGQQPAQPAGGFRYG